MKAKPRIVLLGTGGRFSNLVFDNLLTAGLKPVALALPYYAPVEINSFTIDNHARTENGFAYRSQKLSMPLIYAPKSRQDLLIAQIRALRADFLLVACWPYLLNESCCKSVSKAALNLHPSLLPGYRGANPVAEQMSKKANPVGVTLHLLSPRYDEGDILGQQEISSSADDFDEDCFEIEAAGLGCQLFIDSIGQYGGPGWDPRKQAPNKA